MKVFDCIKAGTFGDEGSFSALISAIDEHGDFYLGSFPLQTGRSICDVLTLGATVSDDFNSYCKTQDLIDEAYKNQEEWVSKSILSVARMGFFTSGTLS